MSVIIAVRDKHNGNFLIGCDSQVTWSQVPKKTSPQSQKIMPVKNCENAYIGVTGTYRHLQLIQQIPDLIPYEYQMNGKDMYDYMVDSFYTKIRTKLLDAFSISKDDLWIEDNVILVYRNHGYLMGSDGCIEVIEDYMAAGSGVFHAQAVLEDLYGTDISAQDVLYRALEAANKGNIYVDNNYVIRKTF
jgi:ATP-dependent protease HslVU (ClpYQ) peptidase subunit